MSKKRTTRRRTIRHTAGPLAQPELCHRCHEKPATHMYDGWYRVCERCYMTIGANIARLRQLQAITELPDFFGKH